MTLGRSVMSPLPIAENYRLLVVEIEMSNCNATIAQDMEERGRQAEELGLATTIRHHVDANKYLALLWNGSPGGEYPSDVSSGGRVDTRPATRMPGSAFPTLRLCDLPDAGSESEY